MTPHADAEAEAQRREAWRELVLDVARTTGKVTLRVTGTSMLPTIWHGDLVTVRCFEASEGRLGQVVVYRREEKLVVHRIKLVAKDHLIAQGDSLPRTDPPVQASEIVGRVVSITRNGRLISPDPSPSQRIVAALLRHLGPCRRILLLADAMLSRLGELRFPWTTSTPRSRRP